MVYGPLRDLVGGAVARDLCLTTRKIDALEAWRLGLGREVAENPVAAALALADEVAASPRDVLVRTKAKIVRMSGVNDGTTLDL